MTSTLTLRCCGVGTTPKSNENCCNSVSAVMRSIDYVFGQFASSFCFASSTAPRTSIVPTRSTRHKTHQSQQQQPLLPRSMPYDSVSTRHASMRAWETSPFHCECECECECEYQSMAILRCQRQNVIAKLSRAATGQL